MVQELGRHAFMVQPPPAAPVPVVAPGYMVIAADGAGRPAAANRAAVPAPPPYISFDCVGPVGVAPPGVIPPEFAAAADFVPPVGGGAGSALLGPADTGPAISDNLQ